MPEPQIGLFGGIILIVVAIILTIGVALPLTNGIIASAGIEGLAGSIIG